MGSTTYMLRPSPNPLLYYFRLGGLLTGFLLRFISVHQYYVTMKSSVDRSLTRLKADMKLSFNDISLNSWQIWLKFSSVWRYLVGAGVTWVLKTGCDWGGWRSWLWPVTTGYDQFFAVFCSFSLVFWLFPFLVNWSQSWSSKKGAQKPWPDQTLKH